MFKAEQCGFPARCAALLKLCSQQCGVEVGRPVAVWRGWKASADQPSLQLNQEENCDDADGGGGDYREHRNKT